jgi:osmotically-inducible protein OsmY
MRFLAALLATLLFGLTIPVVHAAGGGKKSPVTDDAIYDQVRRKLADDPDVKGGMLDVQVHDGVVTLKGTVGTQKAKEKAERLTKKIRGVTKVENQLVVSQ